jgi:hypothetical protein
MLPARTTKLIPHRSVEAGDRDQLVRCVSLLSCDGSPNGIEELRTNRYCSIERRQRRQCQRPCIQCVEGRGNPLTKSLGKETASSGRQSRRSDARVYRQTHRRAHRRQRRGLATFPMPTNMTEGFSTDSAPPKASSNSAAVRRRHRAGPGLCTLRLQALVRNRHARPGRSEEIR